MKNKGEDQITRNDISFHRQSLSKLRQMNRRFFHRSLLLNWFAKFLIRWKGVSIIYRKQRQSKNLDDCLEETMWRWQSNVLLSNSYALVNQCDLLVMNEGSNDDYSVELVDRALTFSHRKSSGKFRWQWKGSYGTGVSTWQKEYFSSKDFNVDGSTRESCRELINWQNFSAIS